jgi:hypothetical protein
MALAALAALGLLATAFGFACGTTDVVVAEVIPPPPPVVAKACTTASDCAAGQYCEMTTCDAAPDSGTCQVATCTDTSWMPQCGCHGNGLVYWNDCVRKHQGAPASQTCLSASVTPTMCGRGLPCPSGSKCNMSLINCGDRAQTDSGPPLSPSCWVLPESCPPDMTMTPGTYYYVNCNSSGCVDNLCAAIGTEEPFALVPVDPFHNPCH